MKNPKSKYDESSFSKITNLVRKNKIIQAILAYKNYLEKYPDDVRARAYYIDSLIKIGEFDLAEYALLETEINKNSNDLDRKCLIIEQIKLLCYLERYDEAFEIAERNRKLNLEDDANIVYLITYIKTKLNLPCKTMPHDSYMYKQIVEYNRDLFFKKSKIYQCSINKPNQIQFDSSFPLEEFYDEVGSILSPNVRQYLNGYDNQYFINYPNCGTINGTIANFIKILTLHDSKNILTIVPTNNVGTLPTIDIRNEMTSTDSQKVKKLSQTDKFYKRYKKV